MPRKLKKADGWKHGLTWDQHERKYVAINKCNRCDKSLGNHKDVLMLQWGEGDRAGQIRPGDSEVRFFCSVECLLENFIRP
jgi:hypothetical protein